MKDRLRQARQAAADLAERAQRLIPGGKTDVDDPSDDDDDEDLPVTAAESADEDLSLLDDEDSEPMPLAVDRSLFDDLRAIDPTPPLPLTAVHETGFVSLLRRLDEVDNEGRLLQDGKVRRILDLVGDRLSLSVGPDGITVRGLLRRRHTAWKHVEHLTVGGRYDLIRGDGLAKIINDIKAKVGLPIPGLSWLIRKVVNGLANWLEKKVFTPEEIESFRAGGGTALLAIQRRGRDIELSGPLLLVSILAPGFSEAVEFEARARKIEVELQVNVGE